MNQDEQINTASSQKAANNKRMAIVLGTLVICIYLGYIFFYYIT